MKTLVAQSHAGQAPEWIRLCTASVAHWAKLRGFDYQLVGDELFDQLPSEYAAKVAGRTPILADLARLQWAERALRNGYQQFLWFDADFLLWNECFELPVIEDALFGRECWLQERAGRVRVYRNVHNAVCGFVEGGVVLPFLRRAVERVIARVEPESIAPQMVGPKLLSALHNIAGFEVCEELGALSPLVVAALQSAQHASTLDDFRRASGSLSGANLCASLHSGRDLSAVCRRLLAEQGV